MIIDTHTHVNFDAFKDDYKEVIDRASKENIWLVNIGSDFATSKRAVEIASEYQDGVYAAIGIHPTDTDGGIFDEARFLELAENEKVVAIGECGLDYFRVEGEIDEAGKQRQKDLFINHIELAKKVSKPLVIHCRDAHEDLLEILNSKLHVLSSIPGVMHFFGGNGAWENVQKYLDLGFYISLSGVVTFPNYSQSENIKNLPFNRILVETDAPYVAPVPMRGKRNEPSYVKYTAQKIAEIRGVSLEEVIGQTTENAKKLFQI